MDRDHLISRRFHPRSRLLTPSLETLRASELLAFGPRAPLQGSLALDYAVPLRFVIKRHRATNLHTDIRLECFGTLISWFFEEHPTSRAGKTIRGGITQDHRLEGLDGEGRIPDGQYGAGPMVVWDIGTYRPIGPEGGDPNKIVLEGLRSGRLDFELDGIRLKGRFRLEMIPGGWRLTKLQDEHATIWHVVWDDLSVLTGRSLDNLEDEYRRGMKRTP